MNRVIVVSKTHLDLGFTDYAANIKDKYLSEFIPDAVETARKLNKNGKKFVWTTGAWILKEALHNGNEDNVKKLTEAIKNGDIAPHACAFTTHTELLDSDLAEYSLSIVDEIDKISGRKTIAAKMTDVPGHTIGIVPFLYKKGIKVLHIGVNGASILPTVPECFLWKIGDAEVVVIYSGDYGGYYKCDLTGDVLYFDHTYDNHGTKDESKVVKILDEIQAKFPDYTVVAGRIDDIAEELWQKRGQLPVVANEIGDTWIHGVASDPHKTSAFKELCLLKNKWLSEKSMTKGSQEYINLCDSLICVAEHTWGMDMKKHFGDFENYLKKQFIKARAHDKVHIRHPFREFPINYIQMNLRRFGQYNKGSYKAIELSWAEQREYLNEAVGALTKEHRNEAIEALALLTPKKMEVGTKSADIKKAFSVGNVELKLNNYGGIDSLKKNGKEYFVANNSPILEYVSYGQKDYQFWLDNYTRNYSTTWSWAKGDFARPLLKYVDKKFPQGRFTYKVTKSVERTAKNGEMEIIITLKTDDIACNELGAPRDVQIIYALTDSGIKIRLLWLNKDANRLTESLTFRLYPMFNKENIRYIKIGSEINPYKIVENGGKKLSATDGIRIDNMLISNLHSPLTTIGEGNILHFDNLFAEPQGGVSFILHNNVWGTNFPLWYEDDAAFDFLITIK